MGWLPGSYRKSKEVIDIKLYMEFDLLKAREGLCVNMFLCLLIQSLKYDRSVSILKNQEGREIL